MTMSDSTLNSLPRCPINGVHLYYPVIDEAGCGCTDMEFENISRNKVCRILFNCLANINFQLSKQPIS